jgi:hypothetical protein
VNILFEVPIPMVEYLPQHAIDDQKSLVSRQIRNEAIDILFSGNISEFQFYLENAGLKFKFLSIANIQRIRKLRVVILRPAINLLYRILNYCLRFLLA